MSFPSALALAATRVQARLDAALANRAEEPVIHAMRYAVAGGKRLRGLLVLESAARFDMAPETAISAAAAVEARHADSLVQDDLPCMAVVYPLKVKTVHSHWPERSERKRAWFKRKKAARLVSEPELAQMILAFDPKAA